MINIHEVHQVVHAVIEAAINHAANHFESESLVRRDSFWKAITYKKPKVEEPFGKIPRMLSGHIKHISRSKVLEDNVAQITALEACCDKIENIDEGGLVTVSAEDAKRFFRVFATADQKARFKEAQDSLERQVVGKVSDLLQNTELGQLEILDAVLKEFGEAFNEQGKTLSSRTKLKGLLHRKYPEQALYDDAYEPDLVRTLMESFNELNDADKQGVTNLNQAKEVFFSVVAERVIARTGVTVTEKALSQLFGAMASKDEREMLNARLKVAFEIR